MPSYGNNQGAKVSDMFTVYNNGQIKRFFIRCAVLSSMSLNQSASPIAVTTSFFTTRKHHVRKRDHKSSTSLLDWQSAVFV